MLVGVPYVACSNCNGLTYVARSALDRAERCPVCGALLEASAAWTPTIFSQRGTLGNPTRPPRPADRQGP